jgi:hypothetical protein
MVTTTSYIQDLALSLRRRTCHKLEVILPQSQAESSVSLAIISWIIGRQVSRSLYSMTCTTPPRSSNLEGLVMSALLGVRDVMRYLARIPPIRSMECTDIQRLWCMVVPLSICEPVDHEDCKPHEGGG